MQLNTNIFVFAFFLILASLISVRDATACQYEKILSTGEIEKRADLLAVVKILKVEELHGECSDPEFPPPKYHVAEAEVIRVRKGEVPETITLVSPEGGICWRADWEAGERWAVSGQKLATLSELEPSENGGCTVPALVGKIVYLTMPGSLNDRSHRLRWYQKLFSR